MLGPVTLSIAMLAQSAAGLGFAAPGPVETAPALPAPAQQEPKPSPADKAGAEAAKKLGEDWKEFTSPDKRFTVRMPGTPIEQKQMAKTPVGDVEVVLYIVPKGQTAAFFASTTQMPKADPNVDPEAVMDGGKTGILAQFPNSKVTEEKKIQYAGLPARELTLEIPEGKVPVAMKINLRLMYGEGMLYQFQAVQQLGPEPFITDEEIAGFFGSVKLPKKD